jgi:hypothetical protein
MMRPLDGAVLRQAALAAVLLLASHGVEARSASRPTDRVVLAYDAPQDPLYRPVYDNARRQKLFERIGAIARLVRLPTRLTYRLKECGGSANAWYDPATRNVTLCLELIAGIVGLAPRQASARGVSREQAIRGPVAQILLHETSHALFDLLHVPVLGREEDAADQVASLLLLHLAPGNARDILEGSAYFFVTLGKQEALNEGSFANAHGLSWQRFYNLACLAYGSDQRRYRDIVERSLLPDERAKGCKAEYTQVYNAFIRLIAPHLRKRPHRGERLQRAFEGLTR